ncbi:MAG: DtxR family transcriptional regulator [Deltaproteobacteria bacterium]|nr:DtxR family transcriptional regulator [Deltaproteobacteria bacterium]
MSPKLEKTPLTDALEDYLETIYLLVRDKEFARVKDIAKARSVKSASVSPAMRRLAEMGLIKYMQREYIGLTEAGEQQARRIYAKHQLLTRFFEDILDMSPKAARIDACAMEHSLSPQAMDRLARFFEFIGVCSEGKEFVEKFHKCGLVHDDKSFNHGECSSELMPDEQSKEHIISVADLQPGEKGSVTHVNGHGAIRQRLLDMGILPKVIVEVERVAPSGDPIWIKLQGFQLSLRRKEADAILVISG